MGKDGPQKIYQPSHMSQQMVYTVMVTMMLTGTGVTIFAKLQNNQVVGLKADGSDLYFIHPIFQAFEFGLGEMLMIVPWLMGKVWKRWQGHKEPRLVQKGKKNYEDHLLTVVQKVSIPAFCDCVACLFMTLGLSQTSASVYQMIRGSLIVMIAIFSKLFLKRQQYLYQWLSICFCILGVTIVGFVGVLNSTKQENRTSVLGIGSLLMAKLCIAIQLILEERVHSEFDVDLLFFIGVQGSWMALTFFLMLVIL